MQKSLYLLENFHQKSKVLLDTRYQRICEDVKSHQISIHQVSSGQFLRQIFKLFKKGFQKTRLKLLKNLAEQLHLKHKYGLAIKPSQTLLHFALDPAY